MLGHRYKVGDTVTLEGTDNNLVLLISEGAASVSVKGDHVYDLMAGNFIGEMGLHVGIHISGPLMSRYGAQKCHGLHEAGC